MKLTLIILLLVGVLLVSGCIGEFYEDDDTNDFEGSDEFEGAEERSSTSEGANTPTETPEVRIPLTKPDNLFDENSFWNTPLEENAAVDAKSDEMMRLIKHEATNGGGFLISWKLWTVPVYLADESTPRVDVPLVIDWTPVKNMALKDVPFPEYAIPDTARGDWWEELTPAGIKEAKLGDAEIAIIDTTTNPWTEYDLWQARKENGEWVASWGNKITLDTNAIYPCGLSGRGSGNAYTAGMIWPEELEKGEINHKLAFSFTYNHVLGPVPPFSESDGREDVKSAEEYVGVEGVYPPPEGAVVQLDPALDLDSFEITDPITGETRGLKDYEKTIAKAMQEYGMADVDNSGAVAVYAIQAHSSQENPYAAFWDASEDYVYLPPELLDHAHVLQLGELQNELETSLTEEQWEYYSCNGEACVPDEICEP